MQHNASEVQQWLERQKLGCLRERMDGVIQATHLLQSRHDLGNVDTLCGDMTDKLRPRQILTLLQHYSDEGLAEPRLGPDFLAAVKDRLSALRRNNNAADATADPSPAVPDKADADPAALIVGTYLAPLDTAPFAYSEVSRHLSSPLFIRPHSAAHPRWTFAASASPPVSTSKTSRPPSDVCLPLPPFGPIPSEMITIHRRIRFSFIRVP